MGVCVTVCALVVFGSMTAAAAENSTTAPALAMADAKPAPFLSFDAREGAVPRLPASFEPAVRADLRRVAEERLVVEHRRPSALIPMYGSLIALQGLDVHSTRRGLTSGRAREANPLLKNVVGNGAAFVAVKTAATAGVIWASERLWKKHPHRTLVVNVLVNAAMAAVVTHNYRVAR